MQETREEHEKAIFFTPRAINPMDGHDFIVHLTDVKKSFSKRLHDTTSATQNPLDKLTVSIVEHPQDAHDETYLEQFQDLIQKLPKNISHEFSNLNNDNSFYFGSKEEVTPSFFFQKQKMLCHTNWLSELQLRCVLSFQNQKFKTVCRIKDAELQFRNGLSFRLTKITKMKVMFFEYQKCITITYDDHRAKSAVETKLRIFLEDDVKDDLFVFFAKIIVEKLMLADCFVDVQEGEDLDCDKFIMKGAIFKKAQVLQTWNERFMILTDRIESFRGDKCTFEMKNIKEIWTRFDMMNGKLIIKLRHGKDKTELAIPVVNYPVKFCKNNWLYRIYRLLSS